jgi:hypothetical protein
LIDFFGRNDVRAWRPIIRGRIPSIRSALPSCVVSQGGRAPQAGATVVVIRGGFHPAICHPPNLRKIFAGSSNALIAVTMPVGSC